MINRSRAPPGHPRPYHMMPGAFMGLLQKRCNTPCTRLLRLATQDNFSPPRLRIQYPLDIATLDIAVVLPIATSTPMELGALGLHK